MTEKGMGAPVHCGITESRDQMDQHKPFAPHLQLHLPERPESYSEVDRVRASRCKQALGHQLLGQIQAHMLPPAPPRPPARHCQSIQHLPSGPQVVSTALSLSL